MKGKALFLVFLIVLSVSVLAQTTRFQAEQSLKTIKNSHNFLESKGLGNERFNDLLQSAEVSYQEQEYGHLPLLEQEMIMLKNLALSLKEKIETINASLSTIEKERNQDMFLLFDEVVGEFSASNYERAKTLVDTLDVHLKEFSEKNFFLILRAVNESSSILLNLDVSLSSPSQIKEEAEAAREADDHATLSRVALSSSEFLIQLNALVKIRETIKDMEEKGFVTTRVEDVFSEALFALEQGRYESVASSLKEISQLKEDAFLLRERIQSTTKNKEGAALAGLDTSKIDSLIEQSKEKLVVNDYGAGILLIQEAQKKLEEIQADALLFGVINKSDARFSILAFLKKTWLAFLIMFLFLGVLGFFTIHTIMIHVLEYRVEKLRKEKEVITELIKRYQHDYYKDHKISKESYETAVDDHQQRLLRIKEALPLLQDKLQKHWDKYSSHAKKD